MSTQNKSLVSLLGGIAVIVGLVLAAQLGTTGLPVPNVFASPIFYGECNDGIDNDADTKIDYPDDLGCVDLSDNSESDYATPTPSSSPTPTPTPELAPSPPLNSFALEIEDGCVDIDVDGHGEATMAHVNGTWMHEWDGPYWVEIYAKQTRFPTEHLLEEGYHAGGPLGTSHDIPTKNFLVWVPEPNEHSLFPYDGFDIIVKVYESETGDFMTSETYHIDVDDRCTPLPLGLYNEDLECLDNVDNDGDEDIDIDGIYGDPPLVAIGPDENCEYWWSSEWGVGDGDAGACENIDITDWSVNHHFSFVEGHDIDEDVSFDWEHDWAENQGYYVRAWVIPNSDGPDDYDIDDLLGHVVGHWAELVIDNVWHEWTDDQDGLGHTAITSTEYWEHAFNEDKYFTGLIRLYDFHDADKYDEDDIVCEYQETYKHEAP